MIVVWKVQLGVTWYIFNHFSTYFNSISIPKSFAFNFLGCASKYYKKHTSSAKKHGWHIQFIPWSLQNDSRNNDRKKWPCGQKKSANRGKNLLQIISVNPRTRHKNYFFILYFAHTLIFMGSKCNENKKNSSCVCVFLDFVIIS